MERQIFDRQKLAKEQVLSKIESTSHDSQSSCEPPRLGSLANPRDRHDFPTSVEQIKAAKAGKHGIGAWCNPPPAALTLSISCCFALGMVGPLCSGIVTLSLYSKVP